MIKKVVFLLLFLSMCFCLSGEEFYIGDIDVSIEGMTNRQSLLRVMKLRIGQKFNSERELENELKIVKDRLDNTRIFKSVVITKEFQSAIDGKIPVVVLVNIVDSWNIIALPYPKYDSNNGFEFKIAVRDYNFMGFMEPLRLDLKYIYDENNKHNFESRFIYTVNFPIAGHSCSLKLSQGFFYTPDDAYGDDFYMNSDLSLGTSFQFPWDIYDGNKVSYTLSASIDQDYIPGNNISENRDELSLGFSHGLSLGHIGWNGNNYREGIYYSLRNDWSYDIDDDRDFNQAWDTSVSATSEFHKDMYPLGYSGRIGLVQNLWEGKQSNIEEPFRGILERDSLTAHGYAYFNNGLYITVWNDENFWEIMGGPILDIGYLWDVPEGQDNVAWSIGVDGLCYPAFAKSFQARITIGMSGNGFMESEGETFARIRQNLELFFGLGTFF